MDPSRHAFVDATGRSLLYGPLGKGAPAGFSARRPVGLEPEGTMSGPRPDPDADHVVESSAASPSDRRSARRRFLMQLGLLAGAGILPIAGSFLGRREAGASAAPRARAARLETARPALGTWVRVVAVADTDAQAARG